MTHVDWQPYPEEKPPCTDDYLITIKKGRKLCVTKDCYDINEGEFEIEFNTKIIAWAEMPEPYKPEEPEDNHPDAITARKYMEGDPETVKALHIFDE